MRRRSGERDRTGCCSLEFLRCFFAEVVIGITVCVEWEKSWTESGSVGFVEREAVARGERERGIVSVGRDFESGKQDHFGM